MKICILDGYTLNPGDLSWHNLERLAMCQIFDRTGQDQILERCADAEIILTNKVGLTSSMLEKLPKLEFISVMATGYNVIDVSRAKELNITVSNAAGYSSQSVAQHTFALILEHFSMAGAHNQHVTQNDGWRKQPDFSYSLKTRHDIGGKKIGLIGYGAIGSQVAKIAQAFGMEVLINRRNTKGELPEGMRYASLEEMAAQCDIISLHCPFTGDNKHMVNEGFLNSMKKSSVLINTSRGQLVDEKALATALNEGQIAGAGLDVLSQEPPGGDSPLIGATNCIITPHNAWSTLEARQRLMTIMVENVRSFLIGDPINVVNL